MTGNIRNKEHKSIFLHSSGTFIFLEDDFWPKESNNFTWNGICSSRPRAEQHLVRWATSQLYDIDAIAKMVDPSIRGQCSEKALSRFADIISRCIQVKTFDPTSDILFAWRYAVWLTLNFMQHEPEFRPPMSEVVQDLTRMVSSVSRASM